MACKVCKNMLYSNRDRKDNISNLQLEFWHQESLETLQDTAENSSCYICQTLNEKAKRFELKSQGDKKKRPPDKKKLLSASLRAFRNRRDVYRLDFKVEGRDDFLASFALKVNEINQVDRPRVLPRTPNTSNAEVFSLARNWISECEANHEKCKNAHQSPAFYPTRLLYIEGTGSNPKVRLVSRKQTERRYEQPDPIPAAEPYVTLSHCWGKRSFTKLTSDTLADFLNDVPWGKLSRTFQEAIVFALKLDIRWIWIDAFCILQAKHDDSAEDRKASQEDWLHEAALMREVYKNAYFNISATSSQDSFGGLYRKRDSTVPWVGEVTVNTKALLSGWQTSLPDGSDQLKSCTIFDLSFWEKSVDEAPVNRRSWVFQERILAPRVVHFCHDQIAFECRDSDRAESRPYGLPHYQMRRNELIDGARLKSFDIETGRQLRLARLKSRYSSKSRLEEMANQEDPYYKRIYLYELWKRIVDAYTKMELTVHKDRLIALSGIAREMAAELQSQGLADKYIAGMWQDSIATHLLWLVNEGEGQNRQPYEDTRPRDRNGHPIYRAPSFSWGSVETPRGISFPEPASDAKSLIEVNVVRLIYETGDDTYGLLTDGYVVLKGVLRRIELNDRKAPPAKPVITRKHHVRSHQRTKYFVSLGIQMHFTDQSAVLLALSTGCTILLAVITMIKALTSLSQIWFAAILVGTLSGPLVYALIYLRHSGKEPNADTEQTTNRYYWRLVSDGLPDGPRYETVYLDSPASQPSIFGPDGNVFCIPALEDEEHLTCLLVQETNESDYGMRYRRIGLAKIRKFYGSPEEILNIKKAPGHNYIKDGVYFWMPRGNRAENTDGDGLEEKRDNESMICII